MVITDRAVMRRVAVNRARLVLRVAAEDLSPKQRDVVLFCLGMDAGCSEGSIRGFARSRNVSEVAIRARLRLALANLGGERYERVLRYALDSICELG